MELSIITINYNGIADTSAFLDSVGRVRLPETEVIVVDNGSQNNEAEQLRQRYPGITVIEAGRNLGFAGGNNLGIKAAHGRYLLLINNDTEIDNIDIEAMMSRLEGESTGLNGDTRGQKGETVQTDGQKQAKVGIVCPKLRYFDGDRAVQFAGYTPLTKITLRNKAIGQYEPDRGQYSTPCTTPYAHGAAMLTTREAIDRVGLMPECYFLYYEEYDWSMMFRRQGYEIWYEPRSVVYHKESRTTGNNSPLKTFYLTRNRFLFAKRNTKGAEKCLTMLYLACVVAVRDVLKHALKGRFDLLKATLRGVTRGLSCNSV